jgi:Carboxymuconolactone decarboxylase family
MPATSPVLDTLTDINMASIEHTQLMPRELMLARLAALVAVDAPPASYLANAGAAADSGVTERDVQDVLIAIAPVVGTAKVVSAGGNLMRALGFAIAVAEEDDILWSDAGGLAGLRWARPLCRQCQHRRLRLPGAPPSPRAAAWPARAWGRLAAGDRAVAGLPHRDRA